MSTTQKKIGKLHVRVVSGETELLEKKIISRSDAEMDSRAAVAVQTAIDKAKVCKKPIAKYDVASKRAYIEHADGVREYVD